MTDASDSNEPQDGKPDRPYKVGYGKPPKEHQFRKGNPGPGKKSGRKGVPGVKTILNKALNERVTVNENGKRKSLTKLEVAIKQFVNKAAAGDQKTVERLLDFVTRKLGTDGEPDTGKAVNTADDDAILDEYLERNMRKRARREGSED